MFRRKSSDGSVRSPPTLFRREPSERLPATNTITGLAVGFILVALLANELVVARFVRPGGNLEATTLSSLRWVQAVLFTSGIILLLRMQAALLALIFGLAILNLSVFEKHVKTAIEKTDGVTEDLLQELRQALPAEGHVGYISDETSPNQGYIETERYNLTQYAVVPIVVETGTTRDLIIGNFKNFDPDQVPGNLVVVRNFGNGLLIFGKRSE